MRRFYVALLVMLSLALPVCANEWYMDEANAVTVSPYAANSFCLGMSERDFQKAHAQLLAVDGWDYKDMLSNRIYKRTNSNGQIQETMNVTHNSNGSVSYVVVNFYTPSKNVADSLYSSMVSNMKNNFGTPDSTSQSRGTKGIVWNINSDNKSVQVHESLDANGQYRISVSRMMRFASRGQETAESAVKWLHSADGQWYDMQGHPALTIGDGYINGCKIVGGSGFAGGYPRGGTFRIVEASGYRDMRINMFGDGIHRYITVDGVAMRKTAAPQYYESIGGVYLGMTKDAVRQLYGQPSTAAKNDWTYEKEGLRISFDGDIVVSMRMLNTGNRHFDRTGLNCNDSLEAYYKAYGMSRMPRTSGGSSAIGHDEYLFFDDYPQAISLSIYSF